ncbi:MAG: spore germination protein [Bacillota bacterium]
MFNKFKNLFKKNNKVDHKKTVMPSDLEKKVDLIKQELQDIDDIIFRKITLTDKYNNEFKTYLIFIKSLIDNKIINDNIITPLTLGLKKTDINLEDYKNSSIDKLISNKIISVQEVERINYMEKALNDILQGKSLLLIDKTEFALSFSTEGWKERNVTMPNVERTIRGPQDAFTENIQVNMGLIRRKVKSKDLKVISITKGKYSCSNINIVYIKGIASDDIAKEVKKRIDTINTGQINGCQHVAELIEDNPISLFNTIYETERPDIVATGIQEGRIAILTDGCPTSLLVPKLFAENFISPEDYYFRFWFTLGLRIMRFIAYILSTILPALYVSIVSFHQELLPSTLVRTIYSAREGVPLPITFELILFGFFFEIVKHAGAAVPQNLSTSITIVGTLIIGQTAITAGFVSADAVIIGAITGITIFLLPIIEFDHALYFFRIFFTLAAGLAGFYGITLVSVFLLAHLASLRSFGVPYLSPIAPLQLQDLKDILIRVPYIFMNTRPESLETENTKRQGNQPVKRFFFKYKISENQKGEKE